MYSAPERTEMKVFSASFTLVGEEQTEILDITKHVREAIQRSPISNGIALINTILSVCGIDLKSLRLLCVKAKNHFRAAFASRCAAIIDCDTPGPACLDLTQLPFRHLRAAVH